jgi:hypothetical protein
MRVEEMPRRLALTIARKASGLDITVAQKPFHLGWFLVGSHAQAWGLPWSGDNGKNWSRPDLYIDLVRAMERACMDYVLLEDHAHVFDRYKASMELTLKHAVSAPRLDPIVMSALLAQATRHIGIIPTVNIFNSAPYHTARQIGTLDQISSGRIGWNMVTGSSDRAAQNYGLPKMVEHDKRYEMATEYVEVVNGLWDTWDPGAIVADPTTGVFADHTKVHRLDFVGKYFSSRGPLNSGPAAQGRPVMAQAGNSDVRRHSDRRGRQHREDEGLPPGHAGQNDRCWTKPGRLQGHVHHFRPGRFVAGRSRGQARAPRGDAPATCRAFHRDALFLR